MSCSTGLHLQAVNGDKAEEAVSAGALVESGGGSHVAGVVR